MPTFLIMDCDYGTGFEFARQYASEKWRVHVICLKEDSEQKISAVPGDAQFHNADGSSPTMLKSLADQLQDEAIDLLINNATTFAPDGPWNTYAA